MVTEAARKASEELIKTAVRETRNAVKEAEQAASGDHTKNPEDQLRHDLKEAENIVGSGIRIASSWGKEQTWEEEIEY